jgi:putative ABC transport system permease protein
LIVGFGLSGYKLMFARLVFESFRRQKRRKLLACAAIALGVSVATAMIAVATGIGDKVNHELRTYGANLIVTPQEDTLDLQIGGVDLKPPSDGAYLNEADLPNIKGMFWRNNIVGFAPMLPVNIMLPDGNSATLLGTYFSKPLSFGKDTFTTGVRKTNPWWKVQGVWPSDDSEDVLVGERLASKLGEKPGDEISFAEQAHDGQAYGGQVHKIAGILTTGSVEDDQIVAPLSLAQKILGRAGAVRRVYVSAVTKPEDAFARRDPKTLTPDMYDRWYCSPYPQSIAFQLQQAIPNSHAEQIRQVSQTEGTILSRIEGLMLLVTLAALLASALAVSAAMATTIFERRTEIGLMKALGAKKTAVAAIFFAEATLLALLGGAVGFAGGAFLAREIGKSIFNSQIEISLVLMPIVLAIAILVTFAGSAIAIRRAVKFDPVYALRGNA